MLITQPELPIVKISLGRSYNDPRYHSSILATELPHTEDPVICGRPGDVTTAAALERDPQSYGFS